MIRKGIFLQVLFLLMLTKCRVDSHLGKILGILNLPTTSPVVDNTPGQFIVSNRTGLIVNENQGTVSFTIMLNKQPKANVRLSSIVSNRTDKISLSVGNILFTTSNWNTPYSVTITGIPDNKIDGNQNWTITLGTSTSTDSNFNSIDAGTVTGMTIDNDTFGITVSPTSGITTSNGGASTFFTVVLNKPTIGSFNVSIPITVSDPSLVTLSASTLFFNNLNWNIPQTVTVTGVITALTPGNQAYTITVGPTNSSISNLSGISSIVSLIHIDSNSNKFDISPNSGILTTKAGGTATINFRLTSAPTSNVQIPISSSQTTQATTSPSFITFSTSNWNTYKTITVTGVNNNLIEGNKPFNVVFGAAVGGGAVFNGVTPPLVSGTNQDTNTPSINLSTTTVSANEGGAASVVTAVLSSVPTSNVTLNMSSSDTINGGTVTASLTFTAANWNVPQNINITPVSRDNIINSNVAYTITINSTSADANYNGLAVGPINATKIDVDSRGYTVNPAPTSLYVSAAGAQASFTVRLSSIPSGGNVDIPLTNYDPAKANISPSLLTFTAANWNVPQTVTITGLDDGSAGVSTFQIQLGTGASPFYPNAGTDDYSTNNVGIGDWNGGSLGNINVQHTGISGTKLITVFQPGAVMQVNEGSNFQYFLNLSQSPTANVSVPMSTTLPTRLNITNPVTLSSANYNQFIASSRVTITGTNDFLLTGNTIATIQNGTLTSGDAFFNSYSGSGQNFTVNVIDTDNFGFTRNQLLGSTNLVTEYSGTNNTLTYRFRLNVQPNPGETCAFTISSSDTTAATVSPSSMTFTNANWNAFQNFVVTGIAGPVLNYNRSFSIQFGNTSSLQSGFNNQSISTIGMTVVSNDIIVSAPSPSNQTSVSGNSVTFTIVLNSPPTANVVIGLSSSDTNAGTVSPSSVTFTTANWNTPRTITVTGVNPSSVQNGIVNYQINIANAVSGDTRYNNRASLPVSMQNLDY